MAKSTSKALSFWAYLALAVSLLAIILSPFRPHSHHHSWFLNLPSSLRLHHSNGKLIKLHSNPQTQIFAIQTNPKNPTSKPVLFIHGLASSSFSFRHVMSSLANSGIPSIAIDLPGSGFSDPVDQKSEKLGGFLGWVLGVFSEIREKGIFWGFEQLVETGEVPVVGKGEAFQMSRSDVLGGVVGEVFEVMSMREPVHVVVHDSAWEGVLSWVSENSGLVSGVTFLDSSPGGLPAFPFRLFDIPVVGDVILRSQVLFGGLVRLCCYRGGSGEGGDESIEGYRVLMKDGVGKKEIVEGGKALNYTFDLGEWVGSEGVKEMKFQLLWSNSWSDRWIDEGRKVAAMFPQAKFAWHSGGRWPQEDSADEIAELIAQFILSPEYWE